jgi:hypothetical protein
LRRELFEGLILKVNVDKVRKAWSKLHFGLADSIVEATRENADLLRQDLINQSVFLVDAPRPASREFVLKRLWLPQARKRFTLDLSN